MRAEGRPSGATVESVIPVGSAMAGVRFAVSRSCTNRAIGSIWGRPSSTRNVKAGRVEKLLARLERRFGRHAPHGLILWIVGISGALHLLVFARPRALYLLWLDPEAVLHGEAWRVVTFLFAPTGPVTAGGLLWTALGLWFLHTMGSALEAQWGAFRFDV